MHNAIHDSVGNLTGEGPRGQRVALRFVWGTKVQDGE